MSKPRTSIIVPTRDRPEAFRRCLVSIQQAHREDCEIIVVDQSEDSRTRAIVAELRQATDIVYIKSRGRGVSIARNEGARVATGGLLLFTDDDCLVMTDWVETWQQAFDRHPSMGIAFGNVKAPPVDEGRGHIPIFDRGEDTRLYDLEPFRRDPALVGMAANLVMRRQVWETVGGFDECLGAGTRYPGASDTDIAYRAVRGGNRVGHVGSATVWHFGYRDARQASRLARGYATGTAAMYVKHVRCGDPAGAQLLALEAWQLFWRVIKRTIARRRPFGLRSLTAYLAGVASCWDQPLDRRRRLYLPDDGDHPDGSPVPVVAGS